MKGRYERVYREKCEFFGLSLEIPRTKVRIVRQIFLLASAAYPSLFGSPLVSLLQARRRTGKRERERGPHSLRMSA